MRLAKWLLQNTFYERFDFSITQNIRQTTPPKKERNVIDKKKNNKQLTVVTKNKRNPV